MTFEEMWRELAPVGRTAGGGYVRQPFTSVGAELRHWFHEAAEDRSMTVEEDGFGNLFAWWGPPASTAAPGVLTGSHLDSVVDGGGFDGPLGVVSAFAAIDLLRGRGVRPLCPLGVAVFAEEEGSRFGVPCLGSRLATGAWSWEQARKLRDRDGVWLRDAMAAVLAQPGGHDPTGAPQAWRTRISCFVELHLEQGRDLAQVGAPVALGSRIWPHGRYRFDFTGQANHAGTTRMEDRHDPMLTYATTALAANEQARRSGQRATFGRLEVSPDVTNVIASRVTGWLDARADSEADLNDLLDSVIARGEQRAGRDGTRLVVTPESVSGGVAFDAELVEGLGAGRGWPVITSAAGHDAGILAAAGIATAMLFVRNPTGISHAPEEFAETADCLAGVLALADVLEHLVSEPI